MHFLTTSDPSPTDRRGNFLFVELIHFIHICIHVCDNMFKSCIHDIIAFHCPYLVFLPLFYC